MVIVIPSLRLRGVLALAAASALLTAGCTGAASGRAGVPPTSPSAADVTPASESPTPPPGGSGKPAVPTNGAYLGAWVNPLGLGKTSDQESGQREIGQLPKFNAMIGTHVQILHVFSSFTAALPTKTLADIEANGSTPLLDWSCEEVHAVASGERDSVITSYAKALKAFAHPIFLRWYWEMNHAGHQTQCGATKDPAAFQAAWRHIWTIFAQQHVTNVAFIWCPGGSIDATPYYPGDQFVDWIGNDHFNSHGPPNTGTAAVDKIFGTFYNQWSGHGKPMMIGATGAKPADQAGYLNGLQTALPTTYPAFKALIYFDAPGDDNNGKGPWNIQGGGVSALRTLAANPYFSFGRHN